MSATRHHGSANDELYKMLGEVLAREGRSRKRSRHCDRALGLNRLQVPAHLTAVRFGKDEPTARLERMSRSALPG